MNDGTIACSLSAGDLAQRLEEIAAVGATSLIAHEAEAGTRLLRFRPEQGVRARLERIVIAERRCCPFLGLGLDEHDGELLLTVTAATEEGQAAAAALAAAFGPGAASA